MLPLWQLVLYAIITIIIVALIRYFWLINRINSKIEWAGGPKPLPILGNSLLMKDTADIIAVLLKLSKEYSGHFRLLLTSAVPASIFITDVNFLQFIMSSNKLIDKSYVYEFLHNWLNLGLLTSTGEKWQQRRKLITPTFHFKILEQFIEIFNNASDILVQRLKHNDGKGEFDIYPYVTLCTLDIICESSMGIKINAQTENSSYVKNIKAITNLIATRTISPLKTHNLFYYLTWDHIKERLLVRSLHNTTKGVIRRRRKELERMEENGGNTIKENDDDVGTKKRSPFLDTLIKSTINGKPLSDDDIREEVDTFMFEGHDTTSSGISFILYALSIHPEIQAKVMEELNSIFDGNNDRPATFNDLQNMKYLEMVVKESIRLFPPVPLIGRLLMEDVTYNGNLMPAYLDVELLIIGLHRDEKIYPDPLKFDPERFTMENQMKRHPYAYIPFSAGPRNCIGQRFAMLELKATVSKVLRHFEVLPAENYEPILVNELVLKSSNGIKLKLKSR